MENVRLSRVPENPRLRLWYRSARFGGLVAAFSMLAWINVAPPQPVRYEFRTKFLASPQRLDELAKKVRDRQGQLAHSSLAVSSSGPELKLVGLRSIPSQVSSELVAGQSKDHENAMILGEATCVAETKIAGSTMESLLNAISEPKILGIYDCEVAKQLRWARWEAQVAQHSLAQLFQNEQVNSKDGESGFDANVIQTENARSVAEIPSIDRMKDRASNSSRSESTLGPLPTPILTASRSRLTERNEVGNFAEGKDGNHLQQQLEAIVQQRMERQRSLETQLSQVSEDTKGKLSLSSPTEIRVIAGKIELRHALAIIAIGLASWFLAAWGFFRIACQRTDQPREIVQFLQTKFGIPFLGSVEGWSQEKEKSNQSSQTYVSPKGNPLELVLDVLLVAFLIVISYRLSLDPTWRTLVVEQPLAALSHLFSQLP